MKLIDWLRLIFPFTVAFDFFVSIFLIGRARHSTTVVAYFWAMFLMVIWEISFWVVSFFYYTPGINNIIDRIEHILGLLAQVGIAYFLLVYSAARRRLVLSWFGTPIILALIAGIIFTNGIGPRVYYGAASYSFNFAYTPLLYAYNIVSIIILGLNLYLLHKLIRPEQSQLEQARRRIVRSGLYVTFGTAVTTLIVIPVILNFLLPNATEILSQDWYVAAQIIGAMLSSAWTVATAYAITRYRLADIHVRYKRNLLAIAGIIFSTLIGLSISYALNNIFGGGWQTLFMITAVMFILVQLLQRYMHTHWLTRSSYDFSLPDDFLLSPDTQGALQHIQQRFTALLDHQYSIKSYKLFIIDWKEQRYRLLSELATTLPIDHGVITYYKSHPTVLFAQDAGASLDQIAEPIRADIQHLMKQQHAAAMIPLSTDMLVYGLVIIEGDRATAELYRPEAAGQLLAIGQQLGAYLERVLTLEALTNQPAYQATTL